MKTETRERSEMKIKTARGTHDPRGERKTVTQTVNKE